MCGLIEPLHSLLQIPNTYRTRNTHSIHFNHPTNCSFHLAARSHSSCICCGWFLPYQKHRYIPLFLFYANARHVWYVHNHIYRLYRRGWQTDRDCEVVAIVGIVVVVVVAVSSLSSHCCCHLLCCAVCVLCMDCVVYVWWRIPYRTHTIRISIFNWGFFFSSCVQRFV